MHILKLPPLFFTPVQYSWRPFEIRANLLPHKQTARLLMSQPSLGASGSVFGVFGISASMFPDNQFVLIFLPFWPISASLYACVGVGVFICVC